MEAAYMQRIQFSRFTWTTSDAVDETNNCVIWEGPATDIGRFQLEIHQDTPGGAPVDYTPGVLTSNDGESWSEVDYVGPAPEIEESADNFKVVGPYSIDQGHGKRLARVVLKVSKSGVGHAHAHYRGSLTIWDAPEDDIPAYKAYDTTRTNTTTYQADPDLRSWLAASAFYRFHARIFVNSPASADIKYRFASPSGATHKWTNDHLYLGDVMSGTQEATGNTTGSEQSLTLTGVVYTGATPGHLEFEWAPNNLDAGNTQVKKGSWLVVQRLDA